MILGRANESLGKSKAVLLFLDFPLCTSLAVGRLLSVVLLACILSFASVGNFASVEVCHKTLVRLITGLPLSSVKRFTVCIGHTFIAKPNSCWELKLKLRLRACLHVCMITSLFSLRTK